MRLERLRERGDFLALRRGLVGRSALFTIQISRDPRDGSDAVRFGLTVTRKVGNAVERNRIKRRLRAALRESSAELPAGLAGRDLAIVARREILDAPYERLKRDLSRTVAKALQPREKRAPHGRERPAGP